MVALAAVVETGEGSSTISSSTSRLLLVATWELINTLGLWYKQGKSKSNFSSDSYFLV